MALPCSIPADDSDDSDTALEFFECSDALTPGEDKKWRQKLAFLLESDDDTDDAARPQSTDCDGCAAFLPASGTRGVHVRRSGAENSGAKMAADGGRNALRVAWTLVESLTRNFLRLLKPLELCGSLSGVAGRIRNARVTSQGADLQDVPWTREELWMEPGTETENALGASEQQLHAETAPPATTAPFQTPPLPWSEETPRYAPEPQLDLSPSPLCSSSAPQPENLRESGEAECRGDAAATLATAHQELWKLLLGEDDDNSDDNNASQAMRPVGVKGAEPDSQRSRPTPMDLPEEQEAAATEPAGKARMGRADGDVCDLPPAFAGNYSWEMDRENPERSSVSEAERGNDSGSDQNGGCRDGQTVSPSFLVDGVSESGEEFGSSPNPAPTAGSGTSPSGETLSERGSSAAGEDGGDRLGKETGAAQIDGNATAPENLRQDPPGETRRENEGEMVRVEEGKREAPLHTRTGWRGEAENSTEPLEHSTDGRGSGGSLVRLPAAGSGSGQHFLEEPASGRALSFSSAWTALNQCLVDAESPGNGEGSKSHRTPPEAAVLEPIRCQEDSAKSGHATAGAREKWLPMTLSKKPRLEESRGVGEDPGGVWTCGQGKGGAVHPEERKEPRKLLLRRDSKAPRLLKKIQVDFFPERSGSIRLCCQFGNVHSDSTVRWTKDCRELTQLGRSAQDDSPVSLVIAEATERDQGTYSCCLSNIYGKASAEFQLSAAVLERLRSCQNYEGAEEIEFTPLLFQEDPLSSSQLGGPQHGTVATEGRHFAEGMHRRAFRGRVLQGLAPAFAPGRACVLKVHSALADSAAAGREEEELCQRSYSLALQECQVQNTARELAKLYATEAEALEGFGEVPEIIPVFLIRRPGGAVPYATVEEELLGEFVKYSVRDGREVNLFRRESEAGRKGCSFQHWVYERTSGGLLVTDLQGVGMKFTDVGIATLAKGYKGFKGNCSFSFIEQFRALHQCNEYCEILGLKPLRAQKPRKAKSKNPPSASGAEKTVPKKARETRENLVPPRH